MELSQSLTIYVGTLLLILGAIYRYKVKHFPITLGNGLTLIVLSYFVGASIVFTIGGIDFVFFASWLLGFGSKQIEVLVIVGSLAGLYVIIYFFRDFLTRNRGG